MLLRPHPAELMVRSPACGSACIDEPSRLFVPRRGREESREAHQAPEARAERRGFSSCASGPDQAA
jgi:hypothetical protein